MMEIKRDRYLESLKLRMHNGMIKVVTGIRRCGKSYLIFRIFRNYLLSSGVDEDHIITFEFDLYDNREYRKPDVILDYVRKKITDSKQYYLLFDEVQMLSDFEEVLNTLMHIGNLDIYVTGSNSKFLSKDVITEFRGRGDEIHMYPLSFKEFMDVYEADVQHGWADYITYGGLPLVSMMRSEEQKMQYLISLFNETYLKDIQERNRIDKPKEMNDLINILSSSIGSLSNPQRITDTFRSVT